MIECAVRPITNPSAFLSDWVGLYAKATKASFFQSPAWMQAWFGGVRQADKLHGLEVRANDSLVGLGVVTLGSRRPPIIGMREAWFHEFGDLQRNAIYPEYGDLLLRDDASPDIRSAGVAALLDGIGAFDGVVFRNLTPEFASAVRCAAEDHGLGVRTLREQPVFTCGLKAKPFAETLSKSLQIKIRRAQKLYEARGALTACLAATPEDRMAAWNDLKRLHGAAWRARGKKSVFDNPEFNAFHDRLRKAAPASTHFFTVKSGAETIAVLYNFADKTRVMNYQSGFKFEEDNRLTPGFVAHALAAEHYRREGFEIYDLLAGEADYKSRLGQAGPVLTSLVLEKPTWRNRLRQILRG